MKLMRRIALVVLIVLLVGGIGLYIASRYLLSSKNVTGQVSTRLQAMLGAPVQVESADVGLTGDSSLHGLRVFEPGDEEKKTPIVTVDAASADASALDLMGGKTPNEISLTGASIALRFGTDGQLLTHMPRPQTGGGSMPHVRIDNGKLTLNQAGRPPMVIQGIKADLTSDGGNLKIVGDVADPFWGAWTLDGSFKNESGAVDLSLAAKEVEVDAARLKGLPFVAPEVWREVMVTGKTSCDFRLGLQLGDEPVIHYRVACAPTDAKVHVESIKLDATGASGNVVADDNLVQLRGVHGRFSGGDLATDGDLDFRKADWVLNFTTVAVDKVVLHELPAAWREALLPDAVRNLDPDGLLAGQAANVRVFWADGQLQVTGEGKGEIDKATIAGAPTSEPIRLKLGTKNGKLHYVTVNPTPRLLATVLTAALNTPPPSGSDESPPPASPELKPVELAGWVPNALVWTTNRGIQALSKGVTVVGAWLMPAGAPEPAPEYLDIDLALEDVDLAQLLTRLQFKLPFPLTGRLSFKVHASIPVNTPQNMKNYRLTGTANLPRVSVAGVEMTDVAARLRLADGIMELQDLKGAFASMKGAFAGSAALELAAPWKYRGALTLSGVDLATAQDLDPDFRPPFPVKGAVDATAGLKGTLSPPAIAASGTAKASDLMLDQFKVDSLTFKWDLDGDRLRATEVKASLYQGDVTGSAALPIVAAAAGDLDLRLDGVDVQALAKSLPAVPLRVEGQASGTVKMALPPAGPDGERAATAKVDLTAKRLRVQNIPADNLHADVDYKGGTATYHLEGESLGGRFKLDGKYPSSEEAAPDEGGAPKEPPEASSGRFQFEGIRLSRLWDALGLGGSLGQIRGRADIDFPFRLAGPDLAPSGTGRLSVRNLRAGDTLLTESLTADLLLRGPTVQVRNLSAAVNQGSFSGVVVYNYRDPERSYFNLQLEQVDAAALLAGYPDFAAAVQGPVDVRLRGNLGREWRGSGEAALTRGHVYGVEVVEWRLPFTFTFHPAHGHGQLTFADSNAQLVRGRVTGRADLHWSSDEAPRLEGNARFYNADLRSLLRREGELGSYAVGQVTGRVDFNSDGLRSLDDLDATVVATLNQSQALQIPVLSVLVPFVAPGRSATTFDQGDLRGRLSRGVFRLQRLTLTSRIVGLVIVGNVTTQGRLDLDVTGNTGRLGINPAFLQAAGVSVPAVGPIPVGVILEVSAYLSNRVVHVRVAGTVRNPDVRLEPVVLLAEEAVRFFMLQSGAPVP